MRALRLVPAVLAAGIILLAACSEDSDCPTCPTPQVCMYWVAYDDFNDDALDAGLWNYIQDC